MLKRVFLVAVLSALASPAMAAAVVSHRAVYDLTLLRTSGGANVSGVTGRMAYEVSGSECDGWTVGFRLVNRFDYKEGISRLFDTQSSSWETGDGKALNYSEKEYVDNKQESETRLSVTRAAKGSVGEVTISLPKEKKLSIPAEAIFPMRHQLRLMEAAAKGGVRDVSIVYDGSDEEKTVRAITTIGRKIDAGESGRDKDNAEAAPLRQLAAWPVSIGYYSTEDNNAETPLYQINFDMYENGVSTGLVMDYGNFALSAKLVHLELLKAVTCE